MTFEFFCNQLSNKNNGYFDLNRSCSTTVPRLRIEDILIEGDLNSCLFFFSRVISPHVAWTEEKNHCRLKKEKKNMNWFFPCSITINDSNDVEKVKFLSNKLIVCDWFSGADTCLYTGTFAHWANKLTCCINLSASDLNLVKSFLLFLHYLACRKCDKIRVAVT